MKIFLIEDDQSIADIYKIALESVKIEVEVFDWGKKAIDRIKEIQSGKAEKPDLILIDLILPDINGMEILKEIKSNGKTKDIKTFILSNYNISDINNSESILPDKFILKTSITPTELIKLIKSV